MKFSKLFFYLFLLLPGLMLVTACGDDDDDPMPTGDNPVASFQFAIDDADFLTVNFMNFSSNATSYAWDFGDGGSSTEEEPSYTYAAAGEYDVTLTATNANGSAMSSKTVTVTDPNEALKLLTGDVSKTWKLFREGTSMSLGPDANDPALWWPGLTNDGSRPCLYEQEFTFYLDGTYEFNDNGMTWAEFGVYNNVEGCDQNVTAEACIEATPENMVNACGDDISAWGSGTHSFSYDPSTGDLTLTGEGAWIGIPKLATSTGVIVPESSVSTKISITEETGYDVMLVEFIYAGEYWPIRYASYSDPSLEPALETEAEEFGEDLDDISPMAGEMFRTFASSEAADWGLLDSIASGSTVEYGVDDPADAAAAKVGQFNRTDAQFQELQFQTTPDKFDINFENLSTVTLDVYLPSTNDYSGGLGKTVVVGLADRSKTEQWWTDIQQYEEVAGDLAEDEWITLTFNLDSPNTVNNPDNGMTPYDRNDFDMFFIQIGGGDHTDTGTFFVRNLSFD